MKLFLLISLLFFFALTYGVEVVNYGVPGLTVKGVSGSRLNKIISHKANLAIIMLGREEMRNPKRFLTPDQLLIDYSNMLKTFKKVGCKVLIINILPTSKNLTSSIDKNIIQANKKLQELAQKENIGFNAYECVSEEWNNLYDKYKNLHQQCVNNDSFGYDNDDVVYSCNGYDITIDSLEPANRVILDFYNDIDVRIYYLNEEEFSNVVEMLEIYATSDN